MKLIKNIEKSISDSLNINLKFELADLRHADFMLTPRTINTLIQESANKQIVDEITKIITDDFSDIVYAEYKDAYVNIKFKTKGLIEELTQILSEDYLVDQKNLGKTVVFDYSSPNIAKPFSVGHLRSTVIGQANLNIHKELGFNAVGVNHIGDWGTQFGKLIYAIKTWGDESEIEKDPITKLNELYVRFHEEAEKKPELEEKAREWFRKIESSEEEAIRLWKLCAKWSFVEFDRIYDILNVKIDEVKGESFYQDRLEDVVKELKEKNLVKESEGALIVELVGLPPALIMKKDGATLYLTRDLATLKYRIENYNPVKIVYHVGQDQALHFIQLNQVAEKLGWLSEKVKIVFAGHGMMRLPEGKMSTRKGRTVLLDDLIKEAQKKSLEVIDQKNPDTENKDELSTKIAISAIKYADLMVNRKSDLIFSFEKFINLSGNSGPYLQYSYARINSLREEYQKKFRMKPEPALDLDAMQIARILIRMETAFVNSATNSSPNILCDYIYLLSNEFNSLYEKKKLITKDPIKSAQNMFVVEVVSRVIEKSLLTLGLNVLDRI